MKKSVKNTMAVCLLSLSMLAVACGKKDKNSSSNVESSVAAPESSIASPESSAPVSSSTSEAHVHSFGEWAVKTPATHTKEGVEERSCACGEKETRSIAKTTAHEFGEWTTTKPATHTAEGEQQRTCACGEKETKTIAKSTSHEWSAWTTKSQETCLAAEVLERTCACGEKETKDGKPATGHDLYSDWRSDDSYHWHACKHDATEQLDKAEHVYDQKVVSEDYLADPAAWYHGNSYFYTCKCGAVATNGFVDESSNPVAKEIVMTETPTIEDQGAIKAVFTNGMESPAYPLPELGNNNFWTVTTENDGDYVVSTYKLNSFSLVSYIKWWNTFESGHTPAEGPQITCLFSTAIKTVYGDAGYTYSTRSLRDEFKNGYNKATGAETFRLNVDDAMSIADKGTVVTGTVEGASVSVGDKVTLYKYGTTETVEYTVSRIEAFKKEFETATPGMNVGMYFEENPDRATIVRGSLLADPSGNWTTTSTVTGAFFTNNGRNTPMFSGYRPTVLWTTVSAVTQFTFPEGVEMIYQGSNCANITFDIVTPQYIFGGLSEYKVVEGREVGYIVLGDYEGKVGEWKNQIAIKAKSKPSSATASTFVANPGHFVKEDGTTYSDPLMNTAVETHDYELYVGVSGYTAIAGRGTMLQANSAYFATEPVLKETNTSGVYTSDTYVSKVATIVYVDDGTGVETTTQNVITGFEYNDNTKTYGFLMRGLEVTSAANVVRMYVEA